MSVLGICPYCGKNIRFSSEAFSPCQCPVCAGDLNAQLLQDNNAFIDEKVSNFSFKKGVQLFKNEEYDVALVQFLKSLEFNDNNYLAYYYAGLCQIKVGMSDYRFETSLKALDLLYESLVKLNNSYIEVESRLPFARAIYKKVYSIVKTECDNAFYEIDVNDEVSMRYRLYKIAKRICGLAESEREILLLSDNICLKSLMDIINLGISAVIKSTAAIIVREDYVDVVGDENLLSAEYVFNNLYEVACDIEPDFVMESQFAGFDELIRFNAKVSVNKALYNKSLTKKDKEYCRTNFNETYSVLSKQCECGIEYTYNMLFKSLYPQIDDKSRIKLLMQGVAFCLQVMMPDVYFDANNKIHYTAQTISNIKKINSRLSVFIDDLKRLNCNSYKAKVGQYFRNLYYITKYYYKELSSALKSKTNKIKQKNATKLAYYSKFLFNIVSAATICIEEFVPVGKIKDSERKSMLKLGYRACKDFLVLYNYDHELLEHDENYSDVIVIYNSLDKKLKEKFL